MKTLEKNNTTPLCIWCANTLKNIPSCTHASSYMIWKSPPPGGLGLCLCSLLLGHACYDLGNCQMSSKMQILVVVNVVYCIKGMYHMQARGWAKCDLALVLIGRGVIVLSCGCCHSIWHGASLWFNNWWFLMVYGEAYDALKWPQHVLNGYETSFVFTTPKLILDQISSTM